MKKEEENNGVLTLVRIVVPHRVSTNIGWRSCSDFEIPKEGNRAAKLLLQKLNRRSSDNVIIEVFGSKEKVEVTLADFRATLAEKECVGDFTSLFAYIRDGQGTLCPVYARWISHFSNHWSVTPCSIRYREEAGRSWPAGLQVLSRMIA